MLKTGAWRRLTAAGLIVVGVTACGGESPKSRACGRAMPAINTLKAEASEIDLLNKAGASRSTFTMGQVDEATVSFTAAAAHLPTSGELYFLLTNLAAALPLGAQRGPTIISDVNAITSMCASR